MKLKMFAEIWWKYIQLGKEYAVKLLDHHIFVVSEQTKDLVQSWYSSQRRHILKIKEHFEKLPASSIYIYISWKYCGNLLSFVVHYFRKNVSLYEVATKYERVSAKLCNNEEAIRMKLTNDKKLYQETQGKLIKSPNVPLNKVNEVIHFHNFILLFISWINLKSDLLNALNCTRKD